MTLQSPRSKLSSSSVGFYTLNNQIFLQEVFHPLPREELFNRFLLLPALNNLSFRPYGSEMSAVRGELKCGEHLLRHHLPRREVVSLHLGFGAERWFGTLAFELFKPQFVPQAQGRSGHPLPVIPSEMPKTHNLAIDIPCDNLMRAEE